MKDYQTNTSKRTRLYRLPVYRQVAGGAPRGPVINRAQSTITADTMIVHSSNTLYHYKLTFIIPFVVMIFLNRHKKFMPSMNPEDIRKKQSTRFGYIYINLYKLIEYRLFIDILNQKDLSNIMLSKNFLITHFFCNFTLMSMKLTPICNCIFVSLKIAMLIRAILRPLKLMPTDSVVANYRNAQNRIARLFKEVLL